MNLNYIKNYNDFSGFSPINENMKGKLEKKITERFLKHGEFICENGEKFMPQDIVDIITTSLAELSWDQSRLMNLVDKVLTIVFVWNDPSLNTMAVDGRFMMYINPYYVYGKDGLGMNKELIKAVIMHEVFHVIYDHLKRERNYYSAKNIHMDAETHHNANLAADIEVNTTLVRRHIISVDELKKNRLLYLDEIKHNVLPMESILDNEEFMNKLKQMCPFGKKIPGNDEVIETTSEFDEAYKETINKIVSLTEKYGPEETLKKLVECGIISREDSNQMSRNADISKLFAMELLRIKDYETFINESFSNRYSTAEDGYRQAITDAVTAIQNELNPPPEGPEGPEGPEPPKGPEIHHHIKGLKKFHFHPKGKKSNKKGGKGGLPPIVEPIGGDNDKDSSDNNSSEELVSNIKGSSDNEINIEYDSKTGSVLSSDDDALKSIYDTIAKEYGDDIVNKITDEEEGLTEGKAKGIVEDWVKNLPENDELKKDLSAIMESAKKYEDFWKKILKNFIDKSSRQAFVGQEFDKKNVRWGARRPMQTRAQIAPEMLKKEKELQTINFYVDVSGSIDMNVVTEVSKALVAFTNSFKYSGLNICCWASKSFGIHKVESVRSSSKETAINEILGYINKAVKASGGTNVEGACFPEIRDEVFNLQEDRKHFDDIHVIITDGGFDNGIENIEEKLIYTVSKHKKGNISIGEKVASHTIWMLYNFEGDDFNKEIKRGIVVKVSSNDF